MKTLTIDQAQPYIDSGCQTEWRDGGFYVLIKKEWVFIITPGSRMPEPKQVEEKPSTFDAQKLLTIALLCALLGGGIGSLGSALIAKNILMNEKGIEGPQGPEGPAGADGIDGKNGLDGLNGKDGVITNLSSVPGWPSQCVNPSITNVTVASSNSTVTYPVLVCGPATTATPTPAPTVP